jgi:hypothetical protein
VAISWDDVVAIAPELVTTPVDGQNTILDDVNTQISDAVWDSAAEADMGRRYLAAHAGTLARLKGRGPITSESLGPQARSYGSLVAMATGSLALSAYGAEYERRARLQSCTFTGAVF